jgi:hypothetical protein
VRKPTIWHNHFAGEGQFGNVPSGRAVGPAALVLATDRGVYEHVARTARVQPPRALPGMRRSEASDEGSGMISDVVSSKRSDNPPREWRGLRSHAGGCERLRGGVRTRARGDVTRESSRHRAHVGEVLLSGA